MFGPPRRNKFLHSAFESNNVCPLKELVELLDFCFHKNPKFFDSRIIVCGEHFFDFSPLQFLFGFWDTSNRDTKYIDRCFSNADLITG